jgi:uncharacterized protein (UPF0262 family)
LPIRAVAIDEVTWGQADAARRAEWRSAIEDLVRDEAVSFDPRTDTVRITITELATAIALYDGDGVEIGAVAFPRDVLRHHIREYVDVVRELARAHDAGGRSRITALDMAKKVTHDAGARALAGACGPLALDHATCRRLFTLIFTLRVDTADALLAHRGHRRVR